MSHTSLLYKIREALGFNKYYPLTHLDSDAMQMRQALLASREARRALFVANLHQSRE